MSLPASRGLGHSDEPHAPLSRISVCDVAEPEFALREKKVDYGIFSVGKLSAFSLLCRKAIFCTLGDLRREVER